jgi:hypothetical protein
MLKIQIPKENHPILKKKKKCYALEDIKYIHSYKDFNNIIIEPYITLFKDDHKKSFQITCDHMFKKVGYGVFVYILKGQIHTFQIFANTTETKPGSNNITKRQITHRHKHTKKKYITSKLTNKNKMGFPYCIYHAGNKWWEKEMDKSIYYHMLQTCLTKSNITTCFFINLYSFPVLFNRKCKQYIFNDIVCKNNQIEHNKYIPVLSGATTKNHFDKCLIYADGWEVITKDKFGLFCKNNFVDSFNKININWNTKTDTVIFRGENKTCYQNDIKNNDRLKIFKMLNNIKKTNDITMKIDAGFIFFKTVSHFIDNKINMNINDSDVILKMIGDTEYKDKVPMSEQSNCKYILNIDGHVNAWRLCFELSYNSCIILFKSKYDSWFYDKLKHMKNVYIIDVNSKTLEKEIYECLVTLQNDDNIGKKIAKGATKLFDEIMNLDYAKKYMTSLLSEPEFDILIPLENSNNSNN